MPTPDPRPDAGQAIGTILHRVELVFLLVIAVFTVAAMIQEIMGIMRGQTVALKDLLLMFIYVEVLGMISVYYESKKIPITLPLFIAITALARLVILQSKDLPPINLLFESGAILILSVACAVITYRPANSKKKDDISV